MRRSYRKTFVLAVLSLLILSLVVLSLACGGPATTTGAATSQTTAVSASTTAAGPATTAGTGKKQVLGFSNPISSNEVLITIQKGMEARAKSLGYDFMATDSELNVDKQLADIDLMAAQKVAGMAIYPNADAASIGPAVDRAKAAGIRVIGINVNVEDISNIGSIEYQVMGGWVKEAQAEAKIIFDQLGKGAKVLEVGIGAPVPLILAHMKAFKEAATALGLDVIGEVDNPTDDAAGARTVVEQALARYPQIDAVFCYNDPSAVGAASALESAGRPKPYIVGLNVTSDGRQAILDGKISASWDTEPVVQGYNLANMLDSLLKTGQTQSVEVDLTRYTKENMASWMPFQTQIDNVAAGKQPK